MQTMMRSCLISLLSAALLLPGCMDLDVGNLNGLDLDDFEKQPTDKLVAEVSVGLLIGNRAGKAGGNGLVSIVGMLGRESYNLDPADPRYRTELLEAPELDPGNAAFGGNFWTGPYGNIRQAYTLLHALDGDVPGMNEASKEAVRGFAKTIIALEFLTLVATHWESRVALDVDRGYNEPLAPLESRDAGLAKIASLLDEALPHLEAGGNAFPFPMSAGFAGFDTPATFVQFNRAIKARVQAYAEDWDGVLTALEGSFISESPANLGLGVYYVYSTIGSDATNGLSSRNLYVHPSVRALAEPGDARVARKLLSIDTVTVPSGDLSYSSDARFAAYYQLLDAPLPVIRNEELILLRAEANVGLGNYEAALDDINFIRVESGGLAPIDALDASNAVDQILQQRFYSLLFEGGHRWIDMRRYDRLQDLLMYDENDGLYVHSTFPIPLNEQNARPGEFPQ
jgi:starch-binding outer membrane protein, SusD/RagB family